MRFSGPQAQTDTWDSPEQAMVCIKHRVIDWASHSPFSGESEVVIMIAVVTEEMDGSDRHS